MCTHVHGPRILHACRRVRLAKLRLLRFGIFGSYIFINPYTPTKCLIVGDTGVALVSSALLADAVIGNVQERTMREYGSRNVEVKFTRICTNSSNFD